MYRINIMLNNNHLILLDFDGTIMKTDEFNWECYNIVLNKYKLEISFSDFLNCISNSHLDTYFTNLGLTNEQIIAIRKEKYDLMLEHIKECKSIRFIKGMEKFIEFIDENNIPHCVVTNTSIKPILMYREHFPLLNKLKNWITREDYEIPKPNSECFELAVKKFGENKIVIGFEDSWVGYQALKGVTDKINIICEEGNNKRFEGEKVKIIKNYDMIL